MCDLQGVDTVVASRVARWAAPRICGAPAGAPGLTRAASRASRENDNDSGDDELGEDDRAGDMDGGDGRDDQAVRNSDGSGD